MVSANTKIAGNIQVTGIQFGSNYLRLYIFKTSQIQNGLDSFPRFHSCPGGCRPKIHLKTYADLNRSCNCTKNPRKGGKKEDSIYSNGKRYGNSIEI